MPDPTSTRERQTPPPVSDRTQAMLDLVILHAAILETCAVGCLELHFHETRVKVKLVLSP